MRRGKRAISLILCILILAVQMSVAVCIPAAAESSAWAGSWGSAPIPTGIYLAGRRLSDFLIGSTVRTVVMTTLGGEKVRLKFANRYGSGDLNITKVRIARTSARSDTAIIEGTSLPVTFGGSDSVSIPKGKTIYSDPVNMHVEQFEKLSISSYFSSFTTMSTGGLINAYSYIDPGDRTEATSFIASSPLTINSGAITYNTTPFLCGLDTYGPGNSCIAWFGDSTLANESPYYLAEKLSLSGIKNVGVVQAAIIGNELLHSTYGVTNVSHLFGDAGLDRFPEDALNLAGVKTVFVKIGLNDILHPRSKSMEGANYSAPTADDIMDGYRKLVKMAHNKGLKIYFFGRQAWKGYARSFYGSEGTDLEWSQEAEDVMVTLNKWLATGSPADGYINVDALRDPTDKNRLYPPYTLDGAHLTPLGAQVLVDLIPDYFLANNTNLISMRAYYESGRGDIRNYTPADKYPQKPTTAPSTAAPTTTAPPQQNNTTAPTVSATTAPTAPTTVVTVTNNAGAGMTEIILVEIPDDGTPFTPQDAVPMENLVPDAQLPQAPQEGRSARTTIGVVIFAVLTTGVITFVVIYVMNKKNEAD